MTPAGRGVTFRGRWDTVATQNISHRFIVNLIPEFAHFAFNTLRSPVVLTGQTQHKLLKIAIRTRSAALMMSPIGPFELDQLLVPLKQGLGFHDPNHVPHGFDGAPGLGFQLGAQDHQR